MSQNTESIGLSALGYYLPPDSISVEDLAASGRTTSSAEKLRFLGFGSVSIAAGETSFDLARKAIDDLVRRSGFDLSRVDLIVYGAGLGTGNLVDLPAGYDPFHAANPLPLFRFPGTRLAHHLGLPRVEVLGVSQLACSTFQACVRVARAMVLTEPSIENVLCVAADRFPTEANREIVYNLMSDGACAGIVSRRSERHRILAMKNLSRGVYWDGEATHDQLIAGFFPLVREAMSSALAAAGLDFDDVRLVIPHNVNHKSWEIVGKIIGVPPDRIYTRNIARFGHAVTTDNVANYLDAIEEKRVHPGDPVLWFVTGFGAHWSCTVLRA
jgi:3-oxoacyl-[acyl-carrier-protein] synthase-3